MATESKYTLPRVMTVKELSDYLRVHPSTIYKLLRRGELPGFRIGTDWRFNAEVIDKWCLERNMKLPDDPRLETSLRTFRTSSSFRDSTSLADPARQRRNESLCGNLVCLNRGDRLISPPMCRTIPFVQLNHD